MAGSPHTHTHAHAPPRSPAERPAGATVRRVFIVTLLLNVAVALAKGGYGYASGSVALGTDAVHAVLDGSSNVLALLSLRWASAPADARHPYGRRKMEILAALGIGVLIVVGLFELGSAALRALIGHRPAPDIGWGGFVVVAATMLVNFFVSRYEERRGHELGSALLCADAQHTRSDLYASGAVILAFAGVRAGWAWADGAAALFVAALVGRAAWLVFRENVPTLLDAAVLDPLQVAAVAGAVPGVKDVHRIRSRGLRSAAHLDLHIEVDPMMNVEDAHALTRRIERELRAALPGLHDVVIRVEPLGTAGRPS